MTFFKKLSVASYILIGAAVLSIIALIVSIVSCSGEGFAIKQMPMIITFTILSVLLIGAIIYIIGKYGDNFWVSLLILATVIVLTLCFYLMIMGKSDLMGTIWFSELERGYKPAEDALAIGVAGIIIYFISAIMASVSAFFSLAKKSQ